jgi:hypothetical protein
LALNRISKGLNPKLDDFVEIEDESEIPYMETDPPDAIPIEEGDENDDYEFQG